MEASARQDGSPLVLLHAIGSSRRAWTPQLQPLGERRPVVAPDLPGHGDAPGPFTLRRAVETVTDAIGAAGGGPAHVVGISGGAIVALLACLENPSRVASLVLSAGIARTPRWFAVQRRMAALMPEPLLERVVRGLYSGGRAELASSASQDFLRAGKGTYVAALNEIDGLDLRGRLRALSVPALVLCGSADKANVGPSRELAGVIPGAELRIVPGATHLWNLQQPELFTRTVAGFVERIDAKQAG